MTPLVAKEEQLVRSKAHTDLRTRVVLARLKVEEAARIDAQPFLRDCLKLGMFAIVYEEATAVV